jgi:hypothetical protein
MTHASRADSLHQHTAQPHAARSSPSLSRGTIRRQSKGRLLVGWTTWIHSTPPKVVRHARTDLKYRNPSPRNTAFPCHEHQPREGGSGQDRCHAAPSGGRPPWPPGAADSRASTGPARCSAAIRLVIGPSDSTTRSSPMASLLTAAQRTSRYGRGIQPSSPSNSGSIESRGARPSVFGLS